MRKTLTLSMILATAIGASSLAFAMPGGAGHDGHRHHAMNMGIHDLRKLDLTDAQHEQIKQIMKQGHADIKTQLQTLRQQRGDFEAMAPDAAGYQAATTKLAQAEADAARARVMQRAAMRAKVYAVLTDTQKAKLATLRAEHQAKRAEWKAKHRSSKADRSSE
ncbi:MAG: Spy/CpxP family protein refolding chaperone [Rhodanobacteraceae bacterium]